MPIKWHEAAAACAAMHHVHVLLAQFTLLCLLLLLRVMACVATGIMRSAPSAKETVFAARMYRYKTFAA